MVERNTKVIKRKEPIRKCRCTAQAIFATWHTSDLMLTDFEIDYDPFNKIFDIRVELSNQGQERIFDFIVCMLELKHQHH